MQVTDLQHRQVTPHLEKSELDEVSHRVLIPEELKKLLFSP